MGDCRRCGKDAGLLAGLCDDCVSYLDALRKESLHKGKDTVESEDTQSDSTNSHL